MYFLQLREAYYIKPASAKRRKIAMLVGVGVDPDNNHQNAVIRERGKHPVIHIVSAYVFNLWRENAVKQSTKRN